MTGANETTWAPDELDRIGAVEVLRLASHRPDGSLRPRIVGSVTGPDAHRVTVRLVPQAEKEQV